MTADVIPPESTSTRPTSTTCRFCNADVTVRATGPIPGFCDTTCRVAWHRSQPGYADRERTANRERERQRRAGAR